MLTSLALIAPFFGVVLVGWAAGRLGVFGADGLDGLNAFIFKIALPPLLFQVMRTAPSADPAAFRVFVVYGAATVAVYLLARAVARVGYGLRGGADAVHAHVSVNGNVGFLGLPLVAAALGPEAALPTAMALTFDIVIIMSVTTLSLELATGRGAVMTALWRALSNPVPLGVFGGLAYGFFIEAPYDAPPPPPVDAFLDLLGQAAAPAALFATGATLAHRRLDQRVAELATATFWKLGGHPIAVAAALIAFAPEAPAVWIGATILAAALPSSNNGVVFAGVYRTYEARASALVLITTALSVLSFAVALAWWRGEIVLPTPPL